MVVSHYKHSQLIMVDNLLKYKPIKMMRKLTIALFVACLFVVTSLEAQIRTPAASPAAKLEQVIGLTKVTVEYSRPAQKGRELFVDVEKWGQLWRTGANGATQITFSDDVKVAGKDVPAGTYAIYSIPDKENWTVMLYKDLSLGGNTPKYDESQELIRFNATTKKMGVKMENFTFLASDVKPTSATIAMWWGEWYVPFTVEVEVESKVMSAIEKTMAGPSRNDYYQAASYFYNTGKDLEQAYAWAKKANEIDARYWQLRLQANIEAKMGDMKAAKATMEKSIAAAKEAGNNAYAEGNMNIMKGWKKGGNDKKSK